MEAEPWPQFLVKSFTSAGQSQSATDESAYYGSYTRLLYYLFGLEGPFEISLQFLRPETSQDISAQFTVNLNNHPVFLVQVNPTASLRLGSKRKQADDQMRNYFRDFRRDLATPRLPAISAFGTRFCFYEYTAATNTVIPGAVPADPVMLNDVAPTERWKYDILDTEGVTCLRQVASDVRAICQDMRP